MRPTALLLSGFAALVVAGCGGGPSNDVPETLLQVVLTPSTPYAGDPVTVNVGASNSQVKLLTLTIDFTDDGIWDDTREFDSRAITAAFVHIYPTPGAYDVRVDITDRTGTTVSRTESVTVLNAPPTVPVRYEVQGISPQGGSCFAADPPVTCDGCTMLVGTSTPQPLSRSLGEVRRGTEILIDQGFNQWPVVTGRQTYSCQFFVHIFAGKAGSETPIGSGSCQTSSQTNPPLLECRVAAGGTVPRTP
jgi:PKD domain